jgi:hypothetical protein
MQFTYPISQYAELRVEFDYDPGESGVHTLPNGDPGYPDVPPSLEITDVQIWARFSMVGPFTNTKISLPEEVTDNQWLEDQAWAVVEAENEAAQTYAEEAREDSFSLDDGGPL